MNTTIRNTALASILFAAASGAAFAAETADLSVKGTIKPAACTPTLSGGGIVDFGTISANSLSQTESTVLPTKYVTLNVTCDAATKVGVKTIDNRAGTVSTSVAQNTKVIPSYSPSNLYGVGAIDGKNIGAYALRFGATGYAPTADGETVDGMYNNNDWSSSTWMSNTKAAAWEGIDQPGNRTFSWGPVGSTAPAAYKTISQPIQIIMGISKISDLPALTKELAIDGSATISIKYL